MSTFPNGGENEIFYDLDKKKLMDRKEFVNLIKEGIYSDFEIRKIGRNEIPSSKKDGVLINNLG